MSYAASTQAFNTHSGLENRMIDPETVRDSSDIIKRSADGGQRKFERKGKAAFRSGGMGHSAYHGDCGNSGTQCGKPLAELEKPLHDRRPKVRGGFCTPNGAAPWTVQIQVTNSFFCINNENSIFHTTFFSSKLQTPTYSLIQTSWRKWSKTR